MNYNSNLTPAEFHDLISVVSTEDNCTEAEREQTEPIEGSVQEVITPMEGEAREVSVSATDELSEIEVPSTLTKFLGTSELPKTIDELNKFIVSSKKKRVLREEQHKREIERECIYILAAVSHALATTDKKSVRV